ncbi:hypothetical protein LV779_14605 [Streptomyces thinghirensis]|nr:hypothetical protein [Streptomyces thinghirensis]
MRSGLEEDGAVRVQVDIEHQLACREDGPQARQHTAHRPFLLDALKHATASPMSPPHPSSSRPRTWTTPSRSWRHHPTAARRRRHGAVRQEPRRLVALGRRAALPLPARTGRVVRAHPGSTDAVQRRAGVPARVRGGVRTYLPGLDPAWKPDAQRHPVMSRRTIEADPRRAASTLAALPQRLSLPAAAARRSAQHSATAHPPPHDRQQRTDLAQLRSDSAALTALLDEAERAEAMQVDEINDLYAELAKTDQASNELRGENEELYDKVQESQRLIRFLREQLRGGRTVRPRPRAGRRRGHHLPGDVLRTAGPTQRADRHLVHREPQSHPVPSTASRWTTGSTSPGTGCTGPQSLRPVLRRRRGLGDFLSWCKSDASNAFPFPAAKVAMRESDTVALQGRNCAPNACSRYRKRCPRRPGLHAGPPEDRRGQHDRPTTPLLRRLSPLRKVYVGYLGPHLRNTLT